MATYLNPEQLAKCIHAMRHISFATGDTVFEEGGDLTEMYIIKKGAFSLHSGKAGSGAGAGGGGGGGGGGFPGGESPDQCVVEEDDLNHPHPYFNEEAVTGAAGGKTLAYTATVASEGGGEVWALTRAAYNHICMTTAQVRKCVSSSPSLFALN